MEELITEKKINFQIPGGKKKERIDVFLTSVIENATRSKIQKLIKSNLVLVNGENVKPNYIICPSDIIDVTIPVSPRPSENKPENIPLDIVYEDEYLLVINKPAGMVVHPAFGNYTGTLVNALLHYSRELSDLNIPDRPGIVHRIDKDTSGLLLVAKNEWIHAQLAKQFADHTIEREYWGICWGIFKKKKGEITGLISRSKKDRKLFAVNTSEGKYAHTFYEVLEEFDICSLIKLNLKTGRTHQIRVHLNDIGHPLFGDPSYGGRKMVYGSDLPKMKSRVNNLLKIMTRQALHAKTLGFYHPQKKENIYCNSELPEDFIELVKILRKQSEI